MSKIFKFASLILVPCLTAEPVVAYPVILSHQIPVSNHAYFTAQALGLPLAADPRGTPLIHVAQEIRSLDLACLPSAAPEFQPPDGVPPPHILLVLGPSGSGKSTLVRRLMNEHPDKFVRLMRVTTRPLRHKEEDEYTRQFLSQEEFADRMASGRIVGPRMRYGFRYGIDIEELLLAARSGRIIVIEANRTGDDLQAMWPGSILHRVAVTSRDVPGTLARPLPVLLRDRMVRRDPGIPSVELTHRSVSAVEDLQAALEVADVTVRNTQTHYGLPSDIVYRNFESDAIGFWASAKTPVEAETDAYRARMPLKKRISEFLQHHPTTGYTPMVIAELLGLEITRNTMRHILDGFAETRQLHKKSLKQRNGLELYSAWPNPENGALFMTHGFITESLRPEAILDVMRTFGKPMSLSLIRFMVNDWRVATHDVYDRLKTLIELGQVRQIGGYGHRKYFVMPKPTPIDVTNEAA
jgi:hypothetical protein